MSPGGEDPVVIVQVRETINAVLAGYEGARYSSPPQSRAQALALAGLLLGRGCQPLGEETRWSCPIAGGQRTVSLIDVPRPAASANGHRPGGPT